MELIQVYKCLCDEQRLRILNLLKDGPLCVCHLQEILDEGQVKVSKQLSYLKKMGMVEVRREANWMIYSLPATPHPVLTENLKCLQDCSGEFPFFSEDLAKRADVIERFSEDGRIPASMCAPGCCGDSSEGSGECCTAASTTSHTDS